jgi:membrane protease YdiL (CAAX protease family)
VPAQARQADLSSRDKKITYWVNSATMAVLAGLALLATWARGDAWSVLGLAPGRRAAGSHWILGLLIALYLMDLARKLATPSRRAATAARWKKLTPFMPANRRECAHSVVMCLSAGCCEELLYRGFLVPYLLALFAPSAAAPFVAVLLPAAIFGLSHRYQGRAAMLQIGALAAGMGWFFLRTQALLPLVILHTCIDLAGVCLSPWLLSSTPSPTPPVPAKDP